MYNRLLILIAFTAFTPSLIAMNANYSKLHKDNIIIFSKDNPLLPPKEVAKLDELIEYIGGQDKYNLNDEGETHSNTHYARFKFCICNTGTRDEKVIEGMPIFPNEGQGISEKDYEESFLEEKTYYPLIRKLIFTLLDYLPPVTRERALIFKIKMVCSHEILHSGLRKHQDYANYLFALITDSRNIYDGEMNIFQLEPNGRKNLHNKLYYYGENFEKIHSLIPRAGVGYAIRERPSSQALEKQFRPLLHGHEPFYARGDNPKRNIVIIRVHLASADHTPGTNKINFTISEYLEK